MRLLDEGTAEPRGAHLRRRSVLLEQLGLREQLAPSGAALRDLTEDRDGALFLLRDESAERAEPGEILVARRKVPEQVADRPDAEPLDKAVPVSLERKRAAAKAILSARPMPLPADIADLKAELAEIRAGAKK